MIINDANLRSLFQGFSASFKQGFDGAESHYRDVATVVPSSTKENTYAWMGSFPKIREWVGDRVINNITAHGYSIVNRDFESTVSVPRNTIEDDQFGIYAPMVQEMGKSAAEFPDEMVFGLMGRGFSSTCYDGQYFFGIDHQVIDPATGQPYSVSNMQDGAGPAWFLLDVTRALKPMIYQERRPYTFVSRTDAQSENVFWRKEYVYGTDGRSNVGFGFWQLARASKADLTAENYSAARRTMMTLKGDTGRILGIKPTLLVVPPALEEQARILLNNEMLPSTITAQAGGTTTSQGGGTNPWKGSANLLVTPWIG